MGIRALLLETIIVLAAIIGLVVTVNSLQVHHNVAKFFTQLNEQHLDSTYALYKQEIIADLLIGDSAIENALLKEINQTTNVGILLRFRDRELTVGVRNHEALYKRYLLEVGKGQRAILTLYSNGKYQYKTAFKGLWLSLLFEVFVLLFGFLYLWWRFNRRLLAPLSEQAAHLKPGMLEGYEPRESAIVELKELGATIKQLSIQVQKQAVAEAEIHAAKQVAHDIRSPLTSLQFLLGHLTGLPEKQRTLMRASIQRMTDIANTLYDKSQKEVTEAKAQEYLETVMISALIDSVLSEKRIQIQSSANIHVRLDARHAYGTFVSINSVEFKRVLSNLLNNCLESFDQEPHSILVRIDNDDSCVKISIMDDGKGIPPEVLEKIGQKGFSYGKEQLEVSGTGLGLYHAKKTVASYNGRLEIDSQLAKGTTVTITLPKSDVPLWFVEKIYLDDFDHVIVLDDDQSIHNLWRDRFEHFSSHLKILHFTSGKEFMSFIQRGELDIKSCLFLMDFELLHQHKTGLDLIEELNIAKKAILVTSYYEDPAIRTRVKKIGVKIIPKEMAAVIPIE